MVTVLRLKGKPKKKAEKNKYESIELKAILKPVKTEVKHNFKVDAAATPAQMTIRKSWLGEYKSE